MALRELAASLGNGAVDRAIARDVEAELTAHLEIAVEALEHEGHAPEQARQLARARFGDIQRVRSECLRIRLGGVHAMKNLLLVVTLALGTALLASLFFARAQHVRAQEAMQEALRAQAIALEVAERARGAALAPVDHIVVEIGDAIETLDQHRIVDIGQRSVVQRDGQVLLADVGWIEVAGRPREEVEDLLTVAYSQYYEDLRVNVIVHEGAPPGAPVEESSLPTLESLLSGQPAATAPVVVEIGDVIETLDQHRSIDFGERADVQQDGMVLLHSVGWIEVVGLTREQVEQRLTEAYAPFYESLVVNVIVHKHD